MVVPMKGLYCISNFVAAVNSEHPQLAQGARVRVPVRCSQSFGKRLRDGILIGGSLSDLR